MLSRTSPAIRLSRIPAATTFAILPTERAAPLFAAPAAAVSDTMAGSGKSVSADKTMLRYGLIH